MLFSQWHGMINFIFLRFIEVGNHLTCHVQAAIEVPQYFQNLEFVVQNNHICNILRLSNNCTVLPIVRTDGTCWKAHVSGPVIDKAYYTNMECSRVGKNRF